MERMRQRQKGQSTERETRARLETQGSVLQCMEHVRAWEPSSPTKDEGIEGAQPLLEVLNTGQDLACRQQPVKATVLPCSEICGELGACV